MAKKSKVKDNEVLLTIPLQFTRSDLQELLHAANFTYGKSLQVDDLMKDTERWKAFIDVLYKTNFMDEIIEGSRDACANDWLYGFGPEEVEE